MPGSDAVRPAPLQPGDWTPTGWGVQHRVRCSDGEWTELVCHNGPLPRSTVQRNDRVATERVRRDADETGRCTRCAALPDLGPIVYPPRGEVRRSADGVIAFAKYALTGEGFGGFGRLGNTGWRPVGDHFEVCTRSGGWLGDWDVAGWERLGNVYDLTDPLPVDEADGPLPLGEIRRRDDGAVAVCDVVTRTPEQRERLAYPDIRWSLLGDDWEGGHGWRTDGDVSSWVRVGNVFELGAAAEPAPAVPPAETSVEPPAAESAACAHPGDVPLALFDPPVPTRRALFAAGGPRKRRATTTAAPKGEVL